MYEANRRIWLAGALLSSLLGAGSAQADEPWGASYTLAQSARGQNLYDAHCANCHGPQLGGGVGPALAGPRFIASWSQAGRNVDDLFYIMLYAMPRPSVGSLSEAENVDILAYILAQNGLSAGSEDLTADPVTLAAIDLQESGMQEELRRRPYFTGTGNLEPGGPGPSSAELHSAETSTDWLYHNHNYRGTRFSPLDEIDTGNVHRLQVACLYQLGTPETFLTGPLVHDGIMYVTTPRITAAIDAATCRERWRHAWAPEDVEVWVNNRGVAIKDGYVVRGTADGYLFALDSADGRLLWARQVAKPAAGETITMAPLIYENLVILGPAGSENNIQGWVGAFRIEDGSPAWRFNTIPKAGEPGFDTWRNDPQIPVGGGAVWTPLSLDVEKEELYVPVTNPAPDFPAFLRPGDNLYTNSLVALDATTGTLNWYAQLVPADDKDWDLTQVSPIFEAEIDGDERELIVAAGKDGIVNVLDRNTHEVLSSTPIGTRLNEDVPISREGTRYCPGVLGGIQWNGPAWHPGTNMLYVPSVDWCWTARLEEEIRLIPGEMYLGATLEGDETSKGLLTAIDASTGRIRWQYQSPEPMVGAVTTTAGGLLLVAETAGDLLAFDAATGDELYRFNTGGSMAGGVITYEVRGSQYVAAASGKGSLLFGGDGAPLVVILRLPET